MSVRTLVVLPEGADDDLCRWLSERSDIELLPPTHTAEEARRALTAERPDLVFLGTTLPDACGFELIESIPSYYRPAIVVTADHPRYAARAFDAGALDYLALPAKQERFQLALERAFDRLDATVRRQLNGRLTQLLTEMRLPRQTDDLLVVKSKGRGFTLVRESKIAWIDAARSYVRINVDDEVLIARETMQSLEERLDESRFTRIHRSTLVNLDWVAEVIPRNHGDYSIVLQNGQRLNLGRSYRQQFLNMLGKPLEPLGSGAAAIA